MSGLIGADGQSRNPGNGWRLAGLAAIVLFCLSHPGVLQASSEAVVVRSADSTDPGETLTFIVAVDRAPTEIRALGVELAYDPKALRYTGNFSRGALVETFEFFNVNEPSPGQIRLGGFTVSHGIAAGKSGELVTLELERIGDGESGLRVTRLVDDLAAKKGVSEPAAGNRSEP